MIESDARCAQGKVKLAREGYARALAAAETHGYRGFAAGILNAESVCDAETGFPAEARQQVTAALAKAEDSDSRAAAAYVFARVGDVARAQKLVDDLAREFPSDTILNQADLPVVRALLSLQRNQPAEAIAQTEAAIPYAFGADPRGSGYFPIYARAESFLHAHDGTKAAAEYQTILDHRGVDPTSVLYSLAHLGLGRAYALQGDNGKAKSAYQDFLAVWKDADPDVPTLKTARAEYDKLK
jgi:tetratricopeptide (TPR) repeat protein